MKGTVVFVCLLVFLVSFFAGSKINSYEQSRGILFVKEPEVTATELPQIKGVLGNGIVDINTATQEELCTLTGIGESFAERIIWYRNENGRFRKPEDIMKVSGMAKSRYEKIKNEICVNLGEE